MNASAENMFIYKLPKKTPKSSGIKPTRQSCLQGMECLNKKGKRLTRWPILKSEPRFKKMLGDCSQLTLAPKGKEGRTSERIMEKRERRPGKFDTNEKVTHAFLFKLALRTVDMRWKKGCPEGTQGYYFNLGWGQSCLSSTKYGQRSCLTELCF